MGILEQKVVIVTGASQHMGKSFAMALAKEGAKVVLTARTEERLKAGVDEIKTSGGEAMYVCCDTTDRSQVDRVVAKTVEAYGKIDILVNVAHGVKHRKMAPFEDQTLEDVKGNMETGYYGYFHFMQASFPYLKESQGKVINTLSASYYPMLNEGYFPYTASKAAEFSMTQIAAREWGKYNINVNGIYPAALPANRIEEIPKEHRDIMLAATPLNRFGETFKDIAPTVVFLASEASDFMTGCVLNVDGGMALHS